ncbi:MAG: tRNA lysidine(34) synthetase TilS [Clostridia bacterium]|jgi:tRNA(Ile)-lysidine synthase|nr:tRNA lysidine(34) synthetase TilS [Clostridia bacterium]MBT7122020.1 tRNA lysidine(34) synthetase TilS [Clostridia bacterium]
METTIKQKLIDLGIALSHELGVAVSGGVDSMVLLRCLYNMKIPVTVYHMEHGIRGAESINDMAFVRAQCEKLNVECVTKSVDVPKLAKEKGVSIETAARSARYEFLDEAQEAHIATAHHMDDMAETVIMNLTRGSGMSGLCGIPERRGKYIRPMLGVSRDEIERYARDNDIEYVTDSTNDDTVHTRNYIRKEIIPRLRQINDGAVANMARSAGLLREDEAVLDDMAKEVDCIEVCDNGVHIDIALFNAQAAAIQKRILRLAIGCKYDMVDVENVHIDNVLRLVQTGKSGKSIDLKYGLFATFVYGKLIIGKQNNKMYNYSLVSLPENGGWRLAGVEFEGAIVKGPMPSDFEKGTEYFDFGAIEHCAMRRRAQGDYIVPLGMSGKKRLSDYLSDRKVPRYKRDDLIVMARGSEVFWVVGVGVSESSKIDEGSMVYKIKYWES